MNLKIMLGRRGPAYPDRTAIIYERIGGALKAGKEKQYLIVPDQFTASAEAALMAHNHLPGLIGAEVLSVKRLEYRVLSEAGGIAREYVDDHGRNMLLQKSILACKKELVAYGKSAGKTGFLTSTAELIAELKAADIGPLELDLAVDNGHLRQRLQDVATIYKTFQGLLGEERVDSEDRTKLVVTGISQAKSLAGADVYFDGFYAFTNLEYQLIAALLETAASVTVNLTTDVDEHAPDAQVFDLTRGILKSLQALAGARGVTPEMEVYNKKADCPRTTGTHLEANLFSYQPQPYAGKAAEVTISQAKNPWDEGEKAAAEILRLVRDEGYRYRDITLVVGSLATYGKTLAKIFARYGLPYFMDDTVAVTDNHFLEAVLAALDAVRGGYGFADLFAYIKTGFAPIEPADSEDLENYALEFGLRGRRMWSTPFTKISDNPDVDLAVLNDQREILMAPLLAFHDQLKAGKTYREKIEALTAFLTATMAEEKLAALAAECETAGDYTAASRYTQIWNVLMEVLDQLAAALGEEPVGMEEFARVLTGGLTGYTIGTVPEVRDAVAVTDLIRSRQFSGQALFVLGINEGSLPAAAGGTGLLSERDRRELAQGGLGLQKGGTFSRRQQELALYFAVTGVSERLYFSYVMADEEGKNLNPSPLIETLLEIFPDLTVRSALQADPWEKISTPAGTLGALAEYYRGRREDSEATAIFPAVEDYFATEIPAEDPLRGQFEILQFGRDYKGVTDILPQATARKLYPQPLEASVSRLEQYRACPYAHFVGYGLSPQERRSYAVEAMDTGNLLHSVMDDIFVQVAQGQKDPEALTPAEIDAIVAQTVEKFVPTLRQGILDSSPRYRYLRRRIEAVGRTSVAAVVDQLEAGRFQVADTEKAFRQEFFIGDQQVKIGGKIDRVDLYRSEAGTMVRVVDYKSSGQNLKLADIYYGLKLQLVVYLDAGTMILEGEEVLPGGAFYFHLDDPLVEVDNLDPETIAQAFNKAFWLKGLFLKDDEFNVAMEEEKKKVTTSDPRGKNLLTLAEMEALRNYVRELIASLCTQIGGGDIRIHPYKLGDKTGCKYCDYKTICQFDPGLGNKSYDILDKNLKNEDVLAALEQLEKGGVDDEMDK